MNSLRPFLNRLFPLDLYTDPVQRRQAIATYIIGVVAFVLTALAGIQVLFQSSSAGTPPNLFLILVGGGLLIAVVSTVVLTRRGQNRLGALILVGIWFLFTFYIQLTGGREVLYVYPTMLLGISLGTLLVGESTVPVTTTLSIVVLIYSDFFNRNIPEYLGPRTLSSFVSIMVVHGIINYTLARGIQQVA